MHALVARDEGVLLGQVAPPTESVKWTLPVYPVMTLPYASVTAIVMLNVVPAVTLGGQAVKTNWLAPADDPAGIAAARVDAAV